MARKTSFVENCSDCLKVMNILSLPSIRKFNSEEKTENLLSNDEESMLIKSFFENGNKSTLTEVKWDAHTFD